MARDDTKLQYDSAWEIDQLIENEEKNIPAGDSVLFVNALVPVTPFYEVYFKPTGDARWFKCGNSSTNGSYTGAVNVFAYIQANVLHVNSNLSGRARWFVWSDKVNY